MSRTETVVSVLPEVRFCGHEVTVNLCPGLIEVAILLCEYI